MRRFGIAALALLALIGIAGVAQPQIVSQLVTFTVGQIPGTGTNDSASAGNVGEVISSTVASGSAVSLSAGTAANITSVSLTAGDWTICGRIGTSGGGTTTLNYVDGGIGSLSATIPGNETYFLQNYGGATVFASGAPAFPVPCIRLAFASTATYYLVVRGSFATSTMSAFGSVNARRMR